MLAHHERGGCCSAEGSKHRKWGQEFQNRYLQYVHMIIYYIATCCDRPVVHVLWPTRCFALAKDQQNTCVLHRNTNRPIPKAAWRVIFSANYPMFMSSCVSTRFSTILHRIICTQKSTSTAQCPSHRQQKKHVLRKPSRHCEHLSRIHPKQ